MVTASRCENFTIYSLKTESSQELEANLRCLQDCILEQGIYKKDLDNLIKMKDAIEQVNDKFKKYDLAKTKGS